MGRSKELILSESIYSYNQVFQSVPKNAMNTENQNFASNARLIFQSKDFD